MDTHNETLERKRIGLTLAAYDAQFPRDHLGLLEYRIRPRDVGLSVYELIKRTVDERTAALKREVAPGKRRRTSAKTTK